MGKTGRPQEPAQLVIGEGTKELIDARSDAIVDELAEDLAYTDDPAERAEILAATNERIREVHQRYRS